MTNFEFLKERSEYALFSAAAMEAERVYATAPSMCAVGCRKALELAVKWVYAADNTRLDHITAMIAADCITNNFPHGYSSLGEYEKILNPKIEDCGGAYWTRTSDPIDVNDVLYQLSQSTMGFRCLFRACFHTANRISVMYISQYVLTD